MNNPTRFVCKLRLDAREFCLIELYAVLCMIACGLQRTCAREQVKKHSQAILNQRDDDTARTDATMTFILGGGMTLLHTMLQVRFA
jgi:hypothetical protein